MENRLDFDWTSLFDAIYMISYAPYKERREVFFKKDLERLNIPKDMFHVYYTVNNPFDKILLESEEFVHLSANMRFNQSALNLALGHYHVMKQSLDLGYNRILILEDDVAFLKDLTLVKSILENFPKDSSIVLFDKVCPFYMKNEYDKSIDNKINEYYAQYDHNLILWTTGCLALDRTGMSHICDYQEKAFNVADFYTNHFIPVRGKYVRYPDKMKTCFSIKSLVCQRPNENTISDHGAANSVYNQDGLYDCEMRIEDYNI